MKVADYSASPTLLAEHLVNTRGSVTGTDYMPDLPTFRGFLDDHGLPVPSDLSERDLDEAHQGRDRLREVFFAPDEETTARLLNELLAELGAVPRLTGDGKRFEFTFVPEGVGIGHRIAILAVMGVARLFVEAGRTRFGICSAQDCNDVFVDTSRNRSRRYCADSCSSRSNVAAFRARQRSL